MINFSKYHGTGNDFILIDDRKVYFPIHDGAKISKLCHRNLGIGADGLILLHPSDVADYRMRIFNSDGKEAKSCGNGLLCLMRFIFDLGLLKQNTFSIQTMNDIVLANKGKDGYEITLGLAKNIKLNQSLILDEELVFHEVDTGNEHVVLFVDDLTKVDVDSLGKKIRSHKQFSPNGVNVNFAQVMEDKVLVRTFEKGVEKETLACGTGAAAVGIISSLVYQTKPLIPICFQHGFLTIDLQNERPKMIGSSEFVFSGSIKL